MTVTVSVTCSNCGNPVVFSLDPQFCGGFAQGCCNCGATVSGSYNWDSNNNPRLYYIRSSGGFKKR